MAWLDLPKGYTPSPAWHPSAPKETFKEHFLENMHTLNNSFTTYSDKAEGGAQLDKLQH